MLPDGAAGAYESLLAAAEREDWPIHQPPSPDAPIPGRHWFAGCEPADYDAERGYHGPGPRVRPDGVCEGCGEKACPRCGAGFYPDGRCQCPAEAAS